MITTERGKEAALEALAVRRSSYKVNTLPRNEDLPAGSPMYYRCIGCGAPIVVGEGWLSKPDCCDECEALQKLGWMK